MKAIKLFPNVQKFIVSASRAWQGIKPVEIKKVLFLLIAHGILALQFDNDSKHMLFKVAKPFHDDSVLALQYYPY